VPLTLGFLQWTRQVGLNANSLITDDLFRIQGTFWHPAGYASFLVVPILASLALFSRWRGTLSRVILLVGISLMMLSLLLTYTRSVWISLVVAIAVYGGLRSRQLVVAVVLFSLLAVILMPQIQERFADLRTFSWRLAQIRRYWDLFLQKPITGYGLGVTLGIGGIWQGQTPDAHNDFIRMSVETGVAGAAAYLGLIATCGWQGWLCYSRAQDEWAKALSAAFLALVVAYAVTALTTNILRNTVTQWLFWTFAGATFSMSSQTPRGVDSISGMLRHGHLKVIGVD
jgi:O-antigen ligase